MDLIEFKQEGRVHNSKHFNFGKSGLVSLSKTLIQELNLKAGTKLRFLQDAKNSGHWYFGIAPSGMELKHNHTKTILTFNSVSLCKKIKTGVKATTPSFKMHMGKLMRHQDSIVYELIYKGQ
tara:strand:+ start:6495 stop:6860 length:366 start_codon:yes stop_codon:yes gene_type:complete